MHNILHNIMYNTICRVTAETKWPPIQSNAKDSLKIMERSFFTAQLVGEACQLGCPKIVLDHVRAYIYVCALWISSLLVVYDAIDNASSSRATRTEN